MARVLGQQREDSISELNVYDDMNIISHHAVNNHYSNINDKGRQYVKQSVATADQSNSNNLLTSNRYLTTADDYTSRNVPYPSFDNNVHNPALSDRRNANHAKMIGNLNNRSTENLIPS